MQERQLRKYFSVIGWVLIFYFLLMSLLVSACQIADYAKAYLLNPDFDFAETFFDGSWGYTAAVLTGLVLLLGWKGTDYWKDQIWHPGRRMSPAAFFTILCVFLGGQLAGSAMTFLMNLLVGGFGMDVTAYYESALLGEDSFSMFLYGGVLAPISEEILFRGFVQRSLVPFGKRFAILGSSFFFGMFHGNLMQAPFAFLVGLILGYTALEYGIGWSMVLHMINNLVLADMLPWLYLWIPESAAEMMDILTFWGFGLAGAAILAAKRRQIAQWLRENQMDSRVVRCFFLNPGVMVFTVLMVLMMLEALFMFR